MAAMIARAPAPTLLLLLFCAGGIFVTYMTYAMIQEWIYLHEDAEGGRFTFTLTLLLVQCVVNFVAAVAWVRSAPQNATPALSYTVPAFTYIFAMLCSNEALKYVSYPTQALAKSCKLVPVMLVDLLVFRKRHSLQQYFMVGLVTVGIVIFQWKQPSDKDQESTGYGLLLLAASLLMDGVTGPAQKHITDKHGASAAQLMLYCNGWAIVYVAAAMVAVGENLSGIQYILQPQNTTLVHYLLLFSVCSAVGQIFIFITVNRFGPLVLATVTTCRKFFTILASVAFFGHQLTPHKWLGVALVFAGLTMEVLHKVQKKPAPAMKKDK